MWFLGLFLGLLIGGVAEGITGAMIGGTIGLFAGLWVGSLIKNAGKKGEANEALERQIKTLFKAVEDIHWRLERIEKSEGLGASPMQQAAAARADQHADRPQAAQSSVPSPTQPVVEPWGRDVSTEVPLPVVQKTPVAESIPEPVVAAAQPAAQVETVNANAETPNVFWQWLTGGNTIVRVGVLILFIGLAFLAKYAAENAMFPIEFRLASVGAGAIALLGVGWRLRGKRSGYALTLQGAGIGVLYLTIFAAYRLYHFLPPGLTFVLLGAIALLAAFLAIRQDAQALAVTGAASGFLAPILAASGGGSHVALFSYYAMLNAGIFVVAWYKAWRPLNLVGFVFTFAIGLVWGQRFYQPEFFATTEPFLVLFFLAYVAIAVMYAFRQAPQLTHYVDGTLIFGVPIVGFGMQAGLVKEFEYGLAFSSLALSAFYLLLSTWLYRRRDEKLRLLVESFLALGVIFATLTLPLALDARWTSAAWALEGAGVYWVGMRQQRKLARAFALMLQVFAALAFLRAWDGQAAAYPIFNARFIGAFLLAAAGMAIHRIMRRDESQPTSIERELAPVMFWWGLGWWLMAALADVDHFVSHAYRWNVALAVIAATVAAFSMASVRLRWRDASRPFLGLLPVMMVLAVIGAIDHGHPFANGCWIIWPLTIVGYITLLWIHEPDESSPAYRALHAAGMLFLAALGAWELHWLTREFDLERSAWSVASLVLVPGLLVILASGERAARRWPVVLHEETYLRGAAVALLAALWVWTFAANFTHDGRSAPLPYLPLLNAIDLAHVFILLALLKWRSRLMAGEGAVDPTASSSWRIAIGLSVFVWLNAVLLRTLHHWADIPYRFERMMASVLVQTSLSIFWTLLALTLMLFGARRAKRGVWFIGAALMAVVVGKLFLVDLSAIGGVERIVSFIGVGVLMLVIGYVAPVPPSQDKQGEAA